jgi:hypothetical protein
MRQSPICTTWKITCRSREGMEALQHWLSDRIALDRVLTDTIRVIPDDVERVETVQHRLGDYFADIRILPNGHVSPESFGLVFHKRPEAGRFWKDLMVNILQEIEATSRTISIELHSKQEMAPIALTKEA